MDDVTIEQLEKWMASMNISMSSEHLVRLLANEKIKPVLKALIKKVAPVERVMHARRLLLYKKLLSLSTNETNSIDSDERLQNLKRYSELKQKLKVKEEEFQSKQKIYLELVKDVQDLIQKIQFASNALDEERQKVLFMRLNNEELRGKIRDWQTVQQDISEIKGVQKQKYAEEKYEKMEDTKIMDVLDDCQSYISKVLVNKNNWDNSSSYKVLKRDVMKNANGLIKGFHWKTIFEALLHFQKKLQNSIEKVEETNKSIEGRNSPNTKNNPTSQKMFGDSIDETIFNIYMQNLEISGKKDCRDEFPRKFPLRAEEIEEVLKSTESHLAVVNHEIQKKTGEYKSMVDSLKKSLEEMNEKMCIIKQVSKLTKKSMEMANQNDVPLHELRSNVNRLTTIARREVELFAEIPLVFLESLKFSGGDIVTGYKLLSNFQKLPPFIERNSKSSLPILDGAVSFAPYDIVVHVLVQLSYFKTLQFTECSLKQNNTSIVPFKAECFTDGSEKMQRMLSHFVRSLSMFETYVDEATSFLQILWSHPLKTIIPCDYVVDGITYAGIAEIAENVEHVME